MSKREILAGSVDQTIDVFIQDSSSTTGAGLAGLVFNSASLTCYYRKGATGASTQLVLATQTVGGAHSDGGFVEIDATNMKGCYRLDLSDTMIATAGMLTVVLRGATNMAPCVLEIEVVSVDKFDSVRGGMTALPNASADAAGGIVTGDGSVTFTAGVGNRPSVDVTALGGTVQSATDLKDFADAGYDPATNKVQGVVLVDTLTTYTGNTPQTGDSFARIGATGSGLTSLAQASAYTATRAGYLDNLSAGAAALEATLTAIKGATWSSATDTLEAIRDRGDAAWITATGFSTHTAANVRTEMDTNSTQLAAIVADTNELQTDDVPGLIAALNDPTAAAIADAVWDEAIAGHTTGTTFGGKNQKAVPSETLADYKATSVTVSDKTGFSLAAAGLDSVVVETGMNARQALSVISSGVAGVLAGAATTSVTIAAAGVPATNRITATVDADGNRSAVTLSLPT